MNYIINVVLVLGWIGVVKLIIDYIPSSIGLNDMTTYLQLTYGIVSFSVAYYLLLHVLIKRFARIKDKL